jgi:hypothetical protein
MAGNAINLVGSMWDDAGYSVSGVTLKTAVPEMPPQNDDLKIHQGSRNLLIHAMWQIRKSKDRSVIVRALGSAIASIMGGTKDFYNGTQALGTFPDTEIDEELNADGVDLSTLRATNFADEVPLTLAEFDELQDVDTYEMASYFGVLVLASVKQPNAQNAVAFNEKRTRAAILGSIEDPSIFVADSPWLTIGILKKIHASFAFYWHVRSHMVSTLAGQTGNIKDGTSMALMNMFLLLSDFGMSALKIIKEATLMYPWIRTEFPELSAELITANNGFRFIRQVPEEKRSFVKAIHMDKFVPVVYSEIQGLTGVCKEVLARTKPSYRNYAGGSVTPQQMEKINAHFAMKADESESEPDNH